MGQREAGRILKPVRCAMNDLGYHGKRLHGARSDTGDKQEISKIGWPPGGRRGKGAVQSPEHDIARPYVVVRRHYEVRQRRLCGEYDHTLDLFQLTNDWVRTAREKGELELPGGSRAMVGQVDYDSLRRSFDSGVRLLDEALQSFRMPMISTRLSRIGIQPC
jgi:hypothetical protein